MYGGGGGACNVASGVSGTTVSAADTGTAWNNSAAHTTNATAIKGMVFLNIIVPPYLYLP